MRYSKIFFIITGIRRFKSNIKSILIKYYPIQLSDNDFLKANDCKTLDSFFSKKSSNFFFDPQNKSHIIEITTNIHPQSKKQTLSDANEISTHIFDLLGSGKVNLGKEIDWHIDFKSGFRWDPQEYYLGTGKHVTLDDQSDVKVPWELSRCQHFVTLGKAYWYTSDEKFAQEFVHQIESWVKYNTIELGVNWACTMDVAIRAVNWIWGYYFFQESHSLTKEFRINFLKNLFLHGRHIIRNLEIGVINGNHYLSDIVGLVYLGIFFQETKDGKKWLDRGLKALIKEMESQVYPDGANFEGSVSYPRLVTELFLSATILCMNNGINFPDWYMERLEKMIEFIMYYTKPDGTAPQIGDNDDGRLHILSNYGNWNRLDHRYLLSAGAVLFQRYDFKQAAGQFHEEALWLCGEQGYKTFQSLNRDLDIEKSLSSRSFPDSGYYIMRDGPSYMIVDCIPADPKAPTGHKHNSRLSFDLFYNNRSFIIDPGTYVYTADKDMRNLFRSTRYHNTVVVDGEEQNKFGDRELFRMGLDATVYVNRWMVNDKFDLLDAEHNGYTRLKEPIVHRRQIFFNKEKEYWIIKDIFTGEGSHQFDLYLHLAPMKLKTTGKRTIETDNSDGTNISIILLEENGIKMEILDGWVSFGYGHKINAPILKYSKRASVPTSITIAITTRMTPPEKDILKDFNDIMQEIVK